MTAIVSSLYAGAVFHLRLRPKRHWLRYDICYALIDLDELPVLAERCRLFAHNRFGLFSLWDRDHGGARPGGLRAGAEARLEAAGIAPDGGPIRLLTLPRMLGYGFNPLSLFFCHRRDGGLAAIVYEVRNTYGERHSYVIPAGADARVVRQQAPKRFHVSPFLDMDARYRFDVIPPGETVAVRVREDDEDGTLLIAGLSGRRLPFDDRRIAWALLRFPLLTLRVVAAIHWQALRLWLKRIRVRRKPVPPAESVTIGSVHAG